MYPNLNEQTQTFRISSTYCNTFQPINIRYGHNIFNFCFNNMICFKHLTYIYIICTRTAYANWELTHPKWITRRSHAFVVMDTCLFISTYTYVPSLSCTSTIQQQHKNKLNCTRAELNTLSTNLENDQRYGVSARSQQVVP